MKAWIAGAGALGVLVLLAGCGPELAETPIGQEEAAWQQAFRQNYSSYRPPRTAPPATVDNVSEKLREKEQEAARFDGAPAANPQPATDDPAQIVDNAAEQKNAPAPADDKNAAETKAEGKAAPAEKAPTADDKKNSFTSTPPDPTGGTVYEVKAGDTLSGIAKRFYGDAGAAGVIERANVDLVKDPNRLRPGMKLIIPQL